MSVNKIQTLLDDIVKNEFTKRNSNLHRNIERDLSSLAAQGLASGGTAIRTIIDLCNNDLSERIHFIYESLKKIINAKNISYDHELHKKAKELVIELSKTAKDECLRASNEVIDRISKGSVEVSTNLIDRKYQLELQEVLNELEIYFDELKNKTTFTFKGWFKEHTTELIIALVSAIVGAIIGAIIT